nr:uncharacterized protein CI109_001839 [Kwoniella shandongensis]KAA5529899.1 hypothetical protein CI109_001839 [Kwoniella shandongensis]
MPTNKSSVESDVSSAEWPRLNSPEWRSSIAKGKSSSEEGHMQHEHQAVCSSHMGTSRQRSRWVKLLPSDSNDSIVQESQPQAENYKTLQGYSRFDCGSPCHTELRQDQGPCDHKIAYEQKAIRITRKA